MKILLNLAIINSELNNHKVSLKLAKESAVLGIFLINEIFTFGDNYLEQQ